MPLITDKIDFLLDKDNQIIFENGDIKFSTGIAAITQQCRINMLMFRDEWFLNLDAGIPYWQSILGKKPTTAIEAAKLFFTAALLSVDGVSKVLKLNVTYTGATRKLSVDWQVSTVFGDTPVDTIELRISSGGE